MLGNYLQQTTSADNIFRCILSWRKCFNQDFSIFKEDNYFIIKHYFVADIEMVLYSQLNVWSYHVLLHNTIRIFSFFQVISTSSNSLSTKLLSYISDTWNVVDIITIVLFIIGMVLRFIPSENSFEAGRVFLALNFVSFFLRLLHIFSVHKELGPKLVMIGRMVCID